MRPRSGPAFGRVLAFAVLLSGLLLTHPMAATEVTEIDQGGTARWSGQSFDSCGMDGRVWPALDGVCWFPVDFRREPGTVEVAGWQGDTMQKAWLRIVERDFGLQDIEFPDDTFVHLSQENLGRLYEEQAQIKPLFRKSKGSARFTLPLGNPAEPLPEGKYFGMRRTFNGEPKNPHTGTDYAIGQGNSVLSVADGKVVLTGDHLFAGTSVYVDHGGGLVSMYFHLSEVVAAEGQEVKKGEVVGKVGSTGRSTGPHLHLGLRWQRARIDPEILMGDLGDVTDLTP